MGLALKRLLKSLHATTGTWKYWAGYDRDDYFPVRYVTQPRLILMDNFETPYNALDGAQKQVEDNLCRLAMLSHVEILVTMRGRSGENILHTTRLLNGDSAY